MKQQTESSQRSFFKIYRQALANSAGVMLAYRSNLIFFFLFESFFLTSSFLGAGLGVSLAGGSINGWSRDQIFALTALNGVSHQFFLTCPNMFGPAGWIIFCRSRCIPCLP